MCERESIQRIGVRMGRLCWIVGLVGNSWCWVSFLNPTYEGERSHSRLPFIVDAIVVLPDHLHCIWTLPDNDADFSTRWRLIKSEVSRHCSEGYKRQRSSSRLAKGEQAIWQRRFWEHQIRDDRDFAQHVDYIHYNPVSHGLVAAPKDWRYSSFHRYVRGGIYPEDWGADGQAIVDSGVGRE